MYSQSVARNVDNVKSLNGRLFAFVVQLLYPKPKAEVTCQRGGHAWDNKNKVKFTLEQALKAQRGSRGRPCSFCILDTRWGGGLTPRACRFTPGKDNSVPIVQDAGWATGQVWAGVENLAPTGIRSPYSPACCKLLYRLCYLGPPRLNVINYVARN